MNEEPENYMVIFEEIKNMETTDLMNMMTVREWLKKGWRLHGGPMIYNGIYVAQAIVK